MPTVTKSARYQLPKKAIKSDCPQCGQRKTFSRYIDTKTSEPLPEAYGRCDRESNCGYYLSPYVKGSSGLSYHDEQKALEGIGPIPKTWFQTAGNLKRKGHVTRDGVMAQLIQMEGATPEQAEKVAAYIFNQPDAVQPKPKADPVIVCIPEEVYQASLGHYEQNQFAHLLRAHLSKKAADVLLDQFHIGTSSRWPGACVFWYVDERSRKRGGQVKLFGEDFHTVKYKDAQGEMRSKTSWVHSAYARRLKEKGLPFPDWLKAYLDEQNAVEKSPCLFGLPQLQSAPIDQPVAIVEAPKTAVLCSHYFPDFIWMAAGGKSYLNAERLTPLKGRKIMLFPDLNACHDLTNANGQIIKGWLSRAQELITQGFDITVSDYLEKLATEEDRAKGLDLADYLINTNSDIKPRLIYANGETIYGEVLEVDPCEDYPADWDASTTCVPIIHTGLPTARIAHPGVPLAFDAAEQLRRIQWCVIPPGIEETDYNPTLITSPNQQAFAEALAIAPDQLPLYQLTHTK